MTAVLDLLEQETDPALAAYCQRWTGREASWRHTSEGGFDPRRYQVVDELPWDDAHAFVVAHHYSGAFPSAVLRYGLTDRRTGRLVGVCVLGNGMTPAVLTSAFPSLEDNQSRELSRLVLLDEVPGNAESWFVGQALELATDDGLRGVVMYSDPNERTTPAGMVQPGHLGIVYQALNCWYVGPSKARYEDHLPDGTVFPERTASKIRGLERGGRGAARRLVQLGADDPGDLDAMTEDQRGAWTTTALAAAGAVRLKRKGKHRYLLATGTALQRRRTYARVTLPRHPRYPKHDGPTAPR